MSQSSGHDTRPLAVLGRAAAAVLGKLAGYACRPGAGGEQFRACSPICCRRGNTQTVSCPEGGDGQGDSIVMHADRSSQETFCTKPTCAILPGLAAREAATAAAREAAQAAAADA
eukprot:459828-Amphidinium_carterae.1